MELLWQDEISIVDRNDYIDKLILNSSEIIEQFRASIRDYILSKIEELKFNNINWKQILDLLSKNWELLPEINNIFFSLLETWEINLCEVIEKLEKFIDDKSSEININVEKDNSEIVLQLLKNIWVTDVIMWKYIEEKLDSELLLEWSNKNNLKYLLGKDNWEITFKNHINPVVKNIISINAEDAFNYYLNNKEDYGSIIELIHFSPNYLSMLDDISCLAYCIENNIFPDENKKEKLELKLKWLWFDNIDVFVKTYNYPDLFEDYVLKYVKDQWILKYYILSKLVFYQKWKVGTNYDNHLKQLYNNWEITIEELVYYLEKNPNNVILRRFCINLSMINKYLIFYFNNTFYGLIIVESRT